MYNLLKGKTVLKIFLIFITSLYLSAFELPKVEVVIDDRPEIVVFKSDSILVGEKLSYTITWKTINATDVNITFFGKVETSGSVTVTEDEYNQGVITLMASSKKSSHIDKRVINNYKKGEPMPVLQDRELDDTGYYNTMPYRRVNPRGVHRRPRY